MKRFSFFLICLALGQMHLFAQEQFDYRRKIDGALSDTWYDVTLPPEIFFRLNRDFSDMRLYAFTSGDTIEIPYLLKIRTDDITEEVIQLPVLNKSKKTGLFYVTFEKKDDRQVNFIDVKFNEPNFFAMARLEGSHDQREWFEIAADQRLLSLRNANADYKVSTINFSPSDYRFFRLMVASDIPLSLEGASFRNQVVKKGIYNSIPLRWTSRQDKKAKQTIIDIRLDHYQPVSNFKIEAAADGDYYRHFTIEYLSDSAQTQKGWVKYYQSMFSGYVTSYTPNSFVTTYDLAKELRITIDNRDNVPLTIKNIEVSGPRVDIVAKLNNHPTFLYYGNSRVSKPAYDLEYFEPKIPSTWAVTVQPEENLTTPPEKVNALFENKMWLWGIMILAIALLGFFTLRMMKVKTA